MGQILHLRAHRRNRAKWSAVRLSGNIVITLEWRTADKALCATQAMSAKEWKELKNPAFHFWTLIEFLSDLAIERGARL
jgi:predicted phosphatase